MVTKTRMSVAEYLALPADEPPWLEYIDGEVVEKPLPKKKHSKLAARLVRRLGDYEDRRGGSTHVEGRSHFEDQRDQRFLLPDVSFFRSGTRIGPDEAMLPPSLAVEIRSPGQTLRYHRDRARYFREHGVEEAWIVDPDARSIEVWDGVRDGRVFDRGDVTSTALDGFSVDIETLFAGLENEIA
jgi:Uma2 family endonuclease